MGMDGLVVADVFDGGSDDGAIDGGIRGSGNDVDLRCANDDVELEICRKRDGEHLTFARGDAEMRQKVRGEGPCSGAVDEAVGSEVACGGVEFDAGTRGANISDGGVWVEVDGGGLRGCEQG